ncbi:MAG: cytochrome c [Puniceicoccaceae bacterium]
MSDDPNNKSKRNDEWSGFDRSGLEDPEVQKIHSALEREKAEPSEGFAAPPLVVVFFSMIVCLWVSWYAPQYMGGFRWDVYDPHYDPDAVAEPTVYDPIARGKRIYTNKCQVCHQQTGTGVPGVYPPLAGADWVAKSPDILVRVVLNGLAGEIVVNGNTYNSAMTAFGNDLSDQEIAEVLTYIRNSWGNELPFIEEAEVAAIRAAVGSRTTTYSPSELLEAFAE